MNKFFQILCLCIAFSTIQTIAQSPNWTFAHRDGGSKLDVGRTITIDDNGNIYIAGTFNGATSIIGTDTLLRTLTHSNLGSSIFIAKYDSLGNNLWAKGFGSTHNDTYLSNIVSDPAGNIYLSGSFSDSITFGSFILTTPDTMFGTLFVAPYRTFTAKLDGSGNVLWAKTIEGGDYFDANLTRSIALDKNNNLFLLGEFSDQLNFAANTLTNGGLFLSKYDDNGNELWIKSWTTDGLIGGLSRMDIDSSDHFYIGGGFRDSLFTLDSQTLVNTSSGNTDIFVMKTDPLGQIIWLKSAGGTLDDQLYSLAVSRQGELSVTGAFNSPSLTLGGNTVNCINCQSNGYAMFSAHLDLSGFFTWSFAGDKFSGGYGVKIDDNGNSYFTGDFHDTLVFDTTHVYALYRSDLYVAKISALGNLIWAKTAGGSNSDIGYGIAFDYSGNSYVTGCFFSDTIHFDSFGLLNAPGDSGDFFVAKIGNSPVGILEVSNSSVLALHYQATSQTAVLSTQKLNGKSYLLQVLDMNGKVIFREQGHLTSSTFSTSINMESFSGGMYIISLKTDKEYVAGKIVIPD